MSDIENPWQSTENVSVPGNLPGVQGGLTDTMLRYLNEASPWLRFVGILGFISCGFTAVTGLITFVVLIAAAGFAGEFSGLLAAFVGLLYVGLAVAGFFPSRFMYSCGAKLRSFQMSRSETELELALKNNKSLWKFIGILCIISLAFVPLMIIGGIVAAVSGLLTEFIDIFS